MAIFIFTSTLVCFFCTAFVSSSMMSRIRVHGRMNGMPNFRGNLGSLTVNGTMGASVVFEKDVGEKLSVNGTVGESVTFKAAIGNHVSINGTIKGGAVLAGSLGADSAINGTIESVEFLDSIPAGFSLNGQVRKDSSGNVYVWNDKPFASVHVLYLWNNEFCDQSESSWTRKCKSFNATFAYPPGRSIVFKGRVGKNVHFKQAVGSNVQFSCDLPDGLQFDSEIPDGTIVGGDNLDKFSNIATLKTLKNCSTSTFTEPLLIFSFFTVLLL